MKREDLKAFESSLEEHCHGSNPPPENLIVVTNCNIGPTTKSIIGNRPNGGKIEVFSEKELLVNITDHETVANFKLLNSKEKQKMLENYKLTEHQLPRIMKSDNISRYFGADTGDVFKIIRKSEVAGRYLYYRIVQ